MKGYITEKNYFPRGVVRMRSKRDFDLSCLKFWLLYFLHGSSCYLYYFLVKQRRCDPGVKVHKEKGTE